jgi:hypothetical protein
MAFQEYSEAYRHEENTIGLTGRPAGTGLYINAQVTFSSLSRSLTHSSNMIGGGGG